MTCGRCNDEAAGSELEEQLAGVPWVLVAIVASVLLAVIVGAVYAIRASRSAGAKAD